MTATDNARPASSLDDAGGGQRGSRATLTPELKAALRQAYGLGSATFEDLGGSSCLNLLVRSGAQRLLARIYRPHVTPARVQDIHRAKADLSAGGIPCSEPMRSLEGRAWMVVEDRVVEVEPYVEHDGHMDTISRLAQGLPILGRIHSILGAATWQPEGGDPLFANYVSPEQALQVTRAGCERIRGWGPTNQERKLADLAEELAERLAAAERFTLQAPRQLVHGDFWHKNVLFRQGHIVLVADLDFMGVRRRIDDLALTLYFADDYCGTPALSAARIAQLCWLTRHYEKGLDSPLAEAERAALPLAIARQPLWSIGVWVALLDCEESARQHAAGMPRYMAWALGIMQDLARWQEAFLEETPPEASLRP